MYRLKCPFCERDGLVFGTVKVLVDAYPVTQGHLLVVPLRHVESLGDMTEQERADMWGVAHRHSGQFNVGMNNGSAAGQTVMHAHLHIIPRSSGDCDDPRGGVRGVIPLMMRY